MIALYFLYYNFARGAIPRCASPQRWKRESQITSGVLMKSALCFPAKNLLLR